MNEIREWRAERIKLNIYKAGWKFDEAPEIIDTLLAALDEKEERLAIKDDALCAATMVGEFAISKLKVATEALKEIEQRVMYNSRSWHIAAAALKEIGGQGEQRI